MRGYPQHAMASSPAQGAVARPRERPSSGHSQWLLLAVVVISTLLLMARLNVDANVADDPLQRQIAERVLLGERPHADFHYAYTGGLAYLHALALRLFGDRVLSLRLMLLVFFVAWVPAFWYIASKLTRPSALPCLLCWPSSGVCLLPQSPGILVWPLLCDLRYGGAVSLH